MNFTPAWRNFRRMQFSVLAAAGLIYALALTYAWGALPGPMGLKLERLTLLPALLLLVSVCLSLLIAPARKWLRGHVWTSFRLGFGQTPVSVLAGLGVLGLMAGFIWFQTSRAATGAAPYPAGVFSGYAAGIGLLIAQWVIGGQLQRDPAIGRLIRSGGIDRGSETPP